MRKCLIFSLIFFAKIALSQVIDNFEDGNFTANPVWSGSNSGNDFAIINNQLRSNSTTTNTNFYLSTASSLASSCVWEFYCNLQFATSGANYVDVYLISDQQNLQSTNINGYFVRIGNTNDEICLYKRNGTLASSVKIIDGADGIVASSTNNRVKIRVSRDAANLFTLERDMTGAGTAYVTEGAVLDASFLSSAYFGFYIQQSTSGFFQKHFFDDISIQPIIIDIQPPAIKALNVISENSIELVFDEAVETAAATMLSNYELDNGYGNPGSISVGTTANSFLLNYSKPLLTGNYVLKVAGIGDLRGNKIPGSLSWPFVYKAPYYAKKGDVRINEIFADPSPQIDLPGLEFIELRNTSSEAIDLKNWKYSDPASVAQLPSSIMEPNSYLILCAKSDTNEFKKYGNVLGISPWPSLNNSGDVIKIYSDKGLMIDSVAYSDTWYKDAEKKAGGWSLEMIDEKSLCNGFPNWMASRNAEGGTPGKQNSIFHILDNTAPLQLLSIAIKDSLTLIATFSRAIDSISALNKANYNLSPQYGQPMDVRLTGSEGEQVELKFSSAFKRNFNYELSVMDITDCSGILITRANAKASLFYPEKIRQGDILLSEILFNPKPNGVDFLEVYNNSDRVLDVKELSLATIKADTLNSIKPVAYSSVLIEPGKYMVLTSNPDVVKIQYQTDNPDAFLKTTALPSLNDDAGTIVLLANGQEIEKLSYTEKMHYPLLKDKEGVSLKRVSFKIPTQENANFRSASATVGFATPGYKNSQFQEIADAENALSLASPTFSPDNDGFEDALLIRYKFNEGAKMATLNVYTDKGILVKRLLRNESLGTEGTLSWDGLDERGQKAGVGIYILSFEVFDLNGKVKHYKKSCVLAAKM